VLQAERAGLLPGLAYRQDRQPWTIRLPLVALRPSSPEDLTVDMEIESFCSLARAPQTENADVTERNREVGKCERCEAM